jgi:phospholipid/cholesterol/gamma-HCH transport system substrate-binding protein
MPQRQQVTWAQLRVGMMVLISLAVLAVGIFFISGQVGFLSRRYELKTFFSSAGGVREGSEVRLAGIPVGNVSHIRISPFTDPARAVEIDMRISRHYQDQIRGDSTASLETAGLLGEAYVDISRGGPGKNILRNGETVQGHEEPDITAIVHNANDVVSNLRVLSDTLNKITTQIESGEGSVGKLIYDQTFYNRLNSSASSVENLIGRVENGQGTVGKLLTDESLYQRSVATLNHVDQVLDDIQHGKGSMAKFINDPSVYNDVHQMVSRGNTLIDNINKGQGTLGKLATDDQLYNRLNTSIAHIDTITARIDQGQGTLGKLSTDPSLFNSLNSSAKSLEEFLTEFRRNPKKYLTLHMHIF